MKETRRVALVTGGGHGIGRAICRGLAADGLIVVPADIRLDWAQECAALIQEAGSMAMPLELDVTSPPSAEAAVRAVLARYGKLDVLVNNAGGNGRAPARFDEMEEEDWNAIVELNLTAHWRMARLASSALRASPAGRNISISSASVHRGLPTGLAAYIAAKAGVIGLVRALAWELAPYGVTVNAVAPGFVVTETPKTSIFGEEGRQQQQRAWLLDQAIPRPGRVEDIAAAVRFLVSMEASSITGQLVTVDGGWCISG